MELNDDLIVKQDRRALLKKLTKLPLTVLCHLVVHWGSKFETANGTEPAVLSHEMHLLIRKRVNRKVVATSILLRFWPRGLVLYQLAQLDSYTLVCKPNSYFWKSSTAYNTKGEKQVISLNPESFVNNLKNDIHKLYLSHIYIFKHPELPMVVCRIQLFEPNGVVHSRHNPEPELVSRRPYYIAIPLNSPYIIHSPDDDSYAQLILQSVQKAIAERQHVVLKSNDEPPVRSLEVMHIVKGVSRFSHSLGPWSSYADASFDISPFGNPNNHISIKGKRLLVDGDVGTSSEAKRLRSQNIMIRFKGSKEGVRAKKAYETQRFKSRIHHLQKDTSKTDVPDTVNKYASLVPAEKVNFVDRKDLPNGEGQIALKFKFRGNDVFGGLHELCEKESIDIDKVPGWLAGENGLDSGTILNGTFIREERKKGGLL